MARPRHLTVIASLAIAQGSVTYNAGPFQGHATVWSGEPASCCIAYPIPSNATCPVQMLFLFTAVWEKGELP